MCKLWDQVFQVLTTGPAPQMRSPLLLFSEKSHVRAVVEGVCLTKMVPSLGSYIMVNILNNISKNGGDLLGFHV